LHGKRRPHVRGGEPSRAARNNGFIWSSPRAWG